MRSQRNFGANPVDCKLLEVLVASQRIQDATIAVVDHKERLMLSRIRFQDGLSELSLESTRETAKRAKGDASEPG